jgi:hypothetical protein
MPSQLVVAEVGVFLLAAVVVQAEYLGDGR